MKEKVFLLAAIGQNSAPTAVKTASCIESSSVNDNAGTNFATENWCKVWLSGVYEPSDDNFE